MLLETVNLHKTFQRGSQNKTAFAAVDHISLKVNEGDFITITGKSGSGKTTLLTLLAGLATPSSGTVLFRGENLYALSDKNLSSLRNRDIGFVPQGLGLLPNLHVFDNVRAPQIFARGKGMDSSRADFLLESMGIAHLAEEYPRNLSGGEMRRASIARALFNDPALLIADEPTSDLDPENTAGILELLQNVNKLGTTLVVVTHETAVAAHGRTRYSMNAGMLA